MALQKYSYLQTKDKGLIYTLQLWHLFELLYFLLSSTFTDFQCERRSIKKKMRRSSLHSLVCLTKRKINLHVSHKSNKINYNFMGEMDVCVFLLLSQSNFNWYERKKAHYVNVGSFKNPLCQGLWSMTSGSWFFMYFGFFSPESLSKVLKAFVISLMYSYFWK